MSSNGLKTVKRNTQIYEDETQVVLHYNKSNGFVENAEFRLLAALMDQIGRNYVYKVEPRRRHVAALCFKHHFLIHVLSLCAYPENGKATPDCSDG